MLLDDCELRDSIRHLEGAYVAGGLIVAITARQRFRKVQHTHRPLRVALEHVLDDAELFQIIDGDVTFFLRDTMGRVDKRFAKT